MFTALKNWLRTRSVRSDVGIARKDRRDARRVGRLLAKEQAAIEKIDSAFEHGNKDEILKAFSTYRLIMTDEIESLQDFIVGYKILLRRAVENIEGLEQDIKMNAHESHKDELLKILGDMERDILAAFKQFFQSLTSFQNTNFTLKKLLDRSSRARELYYQAEEMRGPIRELNAWFRSEAKAERSGEARNLDAELKAYKDASTALCSELSRLSTGIQDVFLFLQDAQTDMRTRRSILESEVNKENYPAVWAKADAVFIETVQNRLETWLAEETKEARILFNIFVRAQ